MNAAPEKVTVKAVVAYAAQLRAQGDLEATRDPYASPYRPTEAAARKLSARVGPEEAINHLRRRAAMHARETREQAVVAQTALKRHAQRHMKHRTVRERERGHLNPGQRIDQAIARLRVVAAPASSSIGGDRVHGGEQVQAPPFAVDAASKAVQLAFAAVREIEDLEDRLKVRDLDKAA